MNAPAIPFRSYFCDGAPAEQEIQLLVGDLQRLEVYAEKGFQVPVPIPVEVRSAYERLVLAGFDRYVIKDTP